MHYLDILLRLTVSVLVGGLIGLDRNLHGKPTGIRTLGLVCLGACVLTLADYWATVTDGAVRVPQRDTSLTQYTQARFTADPGILGPAADHGSLCARIFLRSGERP